MVGFGCDDCSHRWFCDDMDSGWYAESARGLLLGEDLWCVEMAVLSI